MFEHPILDARFWEERPLYHAPDARLTPFMCRFLCRRWRVRPHALAVRSGILFPVLDHWLAWARLKHIPRNITTPRWVPEVSKGLASLICDRCITQLGICLKILTVGQRRRLVSLLCSADGGPAEVEAHVAQWRNSLMDPA